ncbi:MAG: hypothetical protein ABR508_09995, partial [Candidatus Baltobacteraceae bacterium]
VLAAALGAPSCWDIFDQALRTSAASVHPQYVTYDERIAITQNERRWVEAAAFIDYRDDGLARVRDERFNFEPYLTRHAEPGPPELGPYGPGREEWLPHGEPFPTIASVRAQGDMTCRMRGLETYKGHRAYHLTFGGVPASRPSLKALWVDAATGVVWKIIVSGFVNVIDDAGPTPTITNFEVELGYAGPYLVVNHVVWDLRHKEYSQSS